MGIFASAGSIGLSALHQVEIWLRISSLIVGIAVGIATLVGIVIRCRADLVKQRGVDEKPKV